MTQTVLSEIKARAALLIAAILWASAFVGIRAGLESYSPGPLALLRFLVASVCMLLIYPALPVLRKRIAWHDRLMLLLIGAIGLGCYNIALNYGEIVVESGIASFIISLAPVVTVIFATLFLGEKTSKGVFAGMLVCILGVALIALGGTHELHFDTDLLLILLATLICGLYSVMQKPFLRRYHAIEVTAWIIWGGTLFLLFYLPVLWGEWPKASWFATSSVIYLGIFPAALGYIAWSYGLSAISASRASGYLYFMPVFATVMGWLVLGEVPVLLSLAGGFVVLLGVWVVSHHQRKIRFSNTQNIV